MTPEVAETAMAVGEVSIALAVALTAALRFARWAVEREDKRTDDDHPLTPEVREMRRKLLLEQRAAHTARIINYTERGFESEAAEQRKLVDAIDQELLALTFTETDSPLRSDRPRPGRGVTRD